METASAAPSASSPERLEEELRDFSYIVSHDLNASFRYVAEFSDLLRRDLGESASDRQRAYSDQLQRQTQKCAQMMDQLLVFSRVQQKPLNLQRCDATRLMEMATLQLSAEVRAANADIAIEPLGEQVVDSDLMTLAFKEVLRNAITFRQEGQPARVEVRGLETADRWIVQVIDHGIGAPLERQEKLFRMFYQDHPEGAYPGIGAGLAICRRILRRHGGDAAFTPSAGATCVELTLPPAPRETAI